MRTFFLTAFGFLLIFSQLCAFETIKTPIVHEGFISSEIDQLVLEPIEKSPPKRINELKSVKPEGHFEWLNGYWHFSKDRGEYIWISGAWRKAPPHHRWVEGKWLPTVQGWVWQSGFWSRNQGRQLLIVSQAPPEPLSDKMPNPPRNNDSFWISGHWQFNTRTQKYVWAEGQWEDFKPNWIYVPGHFIWNEKGYIYIEPYWDWPLDKRGEAYLAVQINPDEQRYVQYLPTKIVKVDDLILAYFTLWPEYGELYQHHYHYNRNTWDEWKIAPPWWQWPKWFGFNPYDQMWNWWWWTHTKYPAPPWILLDTASSMHAASGNLMEKMSKKIPPYYVTPDGVVSSAAINHAIIKLTGHDQPFLNQSELQRVQSSAWSIRSKTITTMRPMKKQEQAPVEIHPEPYFPKKK
jgi:hypothetical protein